MTIENENATTNETHRGAYVRAVEERDDAQREAARLRTLLEEKRVQLMDALAEAEESRREVEQMRNFDRAARRLVIRAELDGLPYVPTAELRDAQTEGM